MATREGSHLYRCRAPDVGAVNDALRGLFRDDADLGTYRDVKAAIAGEQRCEWDKIIKSQRRLIIASILPLKQRGLAKLLRRPVPRLAMISMSYKGLPVITAHHEELLALAKPFDWHRVSEHTFACELSDDQPRA